MAQITDVLVNLHWLAIMERVEFKTDVLDYKVLHGQAPQYLGPCTRGRTVLHSTGSNRLHMPYVRLFTIDSRAIPVAGPQVWNNLPEHVTFADSLHTFCSRLKTHLMRRSYCSYC